eukprot:TRINITY_DN49795_c0_g1_i1.p1 TRINITY_DN49795_c0_g1~~TRINITY_DN49795_c0_g1_i1.p1  ORF type:complete len:359 (+),score=71.00 TRINITY_DN49795_c0_g1_i1:129-1205(+)
MARRALSILSPLRGWRPTEPGLLRDGWPGPLMQSVRRAANAGMSSNKTMRPDVSALDTRLRARTDYSPGAQMRIRESTPGTMAHHTALQNIVDRLFGDQGTGGVTESFRNRRLRIRANSDVKQQEEVFTECRKFLMQSDRWTFGCYAAYQQKLLDLLGAYSWRRRLSSDDKNVKHLEKELRVLNAMTPIELASNHKRIFTKEAKKLIAEKAGVTEKFVQQVIMFHDVMRADRRWYMIREQFGKKLPQSFEDRQQMAEYDRPFSETELETRQEMFSKEERKMRSINKKPPRIAAVYYRFPSRGGNRWSTRSPRWYPSQWRMRHERRWRLRGAAPGGGGDRGRPWGALASSGIAGALGKR